MPHESSNTLPLPGEYPCGFAWDGESFWHSDQRAGEIYRLSRSTGAVQRTIRCKSARADLAFRHGRLFQIGMRPKRLLVYEAATGFRHDNIPIEPSNGRVTGLDTVGDKFVMCLREPSVVQLRNSHDGSIVHEMAIDGSVSGLAVHQGTVCVGDFVDRCIRIYSIESGEPQGVISLSGPPTGMCSDGDVVWYADFANKWLRAVAV